ncbi:hypothetical protein B0H11DRAFT_1941156 [Mycena galericulata]|nr:hypothetical protein B0H11DRAFT_1941156 [Mycena galericulata]
MRPRVGSTHPEICAPRDARTSSVSFGAPLDPDVPVALPVPSRSHPNLPIAGYSLQARQRDRIKALDRLPRLGPARGLHTIRSMGTERDRYRLPIPGSSPGRTHLRARGGKGRYWKVAVASRSNISAEIVAYLEDSCSTNSPVLHALETTHSGASRESQAPVARWNLVGVGARHTSKFHPIELHRRQSGPRDDSIRSSTGPTYRRCLNWEALGTKIWNFLDTFSIFCQIFSFVSNSSGFPYLWTFEISGAPQYVTRSLGAAKPTYGLLITYTASGPFPRSQRMQKCGFVARQASAKPPHGYWIVPSSTNAATSRMQAARSIPLVQLQLNFIPTHYPDHTPILSHLPTPAVLQHLVWGAAWILEWIPKAPALVWSLTSGYFRGGHRGYGMVWCWERSDHERSGFREGMEWRGRGLGEGMEARQRGLGGPAEARHSGIAEGTEARWNELADGLGVGDKVTRRRKTVQIFSL